MIEVNCTATEETAKTLKPWFHVKKIILKNFSVLF